MEITLREMKGSMLVPERVNLNKMFSRLWFGSRAAAAVELAIVGPVFLLLLFAILGVGLDAFYQQTLDDSVRNAARQVQIAQPAAFSGASFVAAVCGEFSSLAGNCSGSLTYKIQASQPCVDQGAGCTAGWYTLVAAALPTSGASAGMLPDTIGYINGAANTSAYVDNVEYLIQVAYPLPFVIPFFSKAITFTGTTSILATTTVAGEPY